MQERAPEYWILQHVMDGWKLYGDKAFPSVEKAKAYVMASKPDVYKILEVVASYRTQVSLIPMSEE